MPSDTNPPSTPTGVTATYDGVNVNVTFDAATDDVAVGNYAVLRDGVFIGLAPTRAYADTVTEGTYVYTVLAIDTSFNFSSVSSGASITIVASYKPDETVDTTGVTDVSSAMASFLATVPDGTTTLVSIIDLTTDAVYHMESTWFFADRHNLTINGNGATIICSDKDAGQTNVGTYPHRNRSNIEINGNSTNIRFNNLIVRGANPTGGFDGVYDPAYEAQHGFSVVSSTDIDIINCQIYGVWGDFVCMARGVPHTPRTLRCTVDGMVASGNGRQGVALVGADYCTVKNSHLDEMRRTVFDLEPGSAVANDGVTYATITNNIIGRHKLNFVSSGGGTSTEVEHVLIDANQVLGGVTGTAIGHIDVGIADGTTRRADWTVTNNVGTVRYGNQQSNVMLFKQIDGLTVTGNTQPLSLSVFMYCADVQDCTDVDVSDNTIPTPLTTETGWPGGDGQARFKDAAGTVVGYAQSALDPDHHQHGCGELGRDPRRHHPSPRPCPTAFCIAPSYSTSRATATDSATTTHERDTPSNHHDTREPQR